MGISAKIYSLTKYIFYNKLFYLFIPYFTRYFLLFKYFDSQKEIVKSKLI